MLVSINKHSLKMAGRGLTYFAVLFSGLLLMSSLFSPVMTGAKLDPKKVKPTELVPPEMADEGIEVSPNPSPVPMAPDVGRPGANFKGAATWTFNYTNYIFDESLTSTDFYRSLFVLDNWPSFQEFASRLYNFASFYSTDQPSCTSTNPCRITVKPEGKSQKRRPDEERGMAVNNCGRSGDRKFSEFEFKHILRTTVAGWDPEMFGTHAFSAAHWRRADSPYMHATFFFVPKTEVIEYAMVEDEDGQTQCKAQSHYDAWTCAKTGSNEDLYSGCYYSGKCLPTYRKSDGHFMGLDCLEGSGDPSKDFVANPGHLALLQDLFAYGKGFERLPPKHWEIEETRWFADKAKSTRAGLRFTEPRPKPYTTAREDLFQAYLDWLLRRPTEKMPVEVRRLFYRQPYLLFGESMRKPGAPTEGYIEREFLKLVVNPLFVPDPDPAKIVVPFVWSGNRESTGSEEKKREVDDGAPEWDVNMFDNGKGVKKPPVDIPGEDIDAEVYISKAEEARDEFAIKLEAIQVQ